MFYEPEKRNHGLPRDPFKALVVPRREQRGPCR